MRLFALGGRGWRVHSGISIPSGVYGGGSFINFHNVGGTYVVLALVVGLLVTMVTGARDGGGGGGGGNGGGGEREKTAGDRRLRETEIENGAIAGLIEERQHQRAIPPEWQEGGERGAGQVADDRELTGAEEDNINKNNNDESAEGEGEEIPADGGGGGGGRDGVNNNNNDIMLDLNKLARLGNKDKLLSMLKQIADSIHKCGVKEVPPLKRHFLTNQTVTCNDGSPAGYYLRRSYGSSKWIVFLEDGWYCFDRQSCESRWVTMKPYMSSKHWPETKKGSGIMSWDPEENPYYYHANMVYLPYCSSDTWTGTYKATSRDKFSFMGSLIVDEVLKDLLAQGLTKGKKLILAGSSAGGTGVLMNLDRVADNMAQWAPNIEVRGVSDSGWFLDNKQYKPGPCMNAHSCAPVDGIKRGVDLWQGQLPKRCAARYAQSERWRCYFGYRLYPTLKTPVYIVQYLFDVAQLTADNVGPPVHKEQWQYIHKLGREIKESLKNVSAVFAPACMSHIMLMKRDWNLVTIGKVSLPHSIYCWESSSTRRRNYRCRGSAGGGGRDGRGGGNQQNRGTTPRSSLSVSTPDEASSDNPLSDAPKTKRNRRKKNKKKRRNKKRRRNQGARGRRSLEPWLEGIPNEVCRRRLIDNCEWPQCNSACPKLVNPLTGVEVDVVDLLVQLGIDPATFANTLGIDIHRLQKMSHDKLIQRLAQ